MCRWIAHGRTMRQVRTAAYSQKWEESRPMNLEEAISAVERCGSKEELRQTLQAIGEGYGFASFNFLDTGATHLDRPFHLGSMKEVFADDYFGNGLVHVDPCIAHARRTNIPFTWGEVPFPAYPSGPKSGALITLEVATDHGYREGLVVPFHFSDAIGRVYSSLIVFFWSDPVQRFKFAISFKKHELSVVMIYWGQRAVEILGEGFRAGTCFLPKDGVKCDRLTDRERDVLSWAARGKTALDTAELLGLTEDTVNKHIRHAIQKLGANNKTHAVARAINLLFIDI